MSDEHDIETGSVFYRGASCESHDWGTSTGSAFCCQESCESDTEGREESPVVEVVPGEVVASRRGRRRALTPWRVKFQPEDVGCRSHDCEIATWSDFYRESSCEIHIEGQAGFPVGELVAGKSVNRIHGAWSLP